MTHMQVNLKLTEWLPGIIMSHYTGQENLSLHFLNGSILKNNNLKQNKIWLYSQTKNK